LLAVLRPEGRLPQKAALWLEERPLVPARLEPGLCTQEKRHPA
jgi:hypothetical protein